VSSVADLRRLRLAQQVKHAALKKAQQITPLIFFRMVAKGRAARRSRGVKSLHGHGRWLGAAGLPGRLLHDLRRSAVRNIDRSGISPTVGMQMVGHRTESIYNRYNLRSDGDLREAARRLDAANTVGEVRRSSR
jgi:integrase